MMALHRELLDKNQSSRVFILSTIFCYGDSVFLMILHVTNVPILKNWHGCVFKAGSWKLISKEGHATIRRWAWAWGKLDKKFGYHSSCLVWRPCIIWCLCAYLLVLQIWCLHNHLFDSSFFIFWLSLCFYIPTHRFTSSMMLVWVSMYHDLPH